MFKTQLLGQMLPFRVLLPLEKEKEPSIIVSVLQVVHLVQEFEMKAKCAVFFLSFDKDMK